VADRVALALGKLCYGRKAPLSPLVQQHSHRSAVTLRFDQPLQDGEVYEYCVGRHDGRYHNAKAVAKGNTVTVTCVAVSSPPACAKCLEEQSDKPMCATVRDCPPVRSNVSSKKKVRFLGY
jgi:hypothetical protein